MAARSVQRQARNMTDRHRYSGTALTLVIAAVSSIAATQALAQTTTVPTSVGGSISATPPEPTGATLGGGQGARPVQVQIPGQPGVGNTSGDAAAPSPAEANKAALQEMFKELLPEVNILTPAQEREVIRKSEETAKARTRQSPQFSNVLLNVTLDPSAKIETIEMDLGQPTTVSFIDRTGERWPIEECHWSAGFRTPQGTKLLPGAHTLTLQTTSLVEDGALVCNMKGLTTPVNLILSAGHHKHYLRVDARIPRNGPNARPAPYDLSGSALIQAGSDDLTSFLYGIPPSGAEPLDIDGGGGDTKAWRYGDALYVRTPMVLLSPGPKRETRLEGMNVYMLDPLPILTFEYDHHDVEIRIRGARIVRAALPKNVIGNQDAPESPLVLTSRETRVGETKPNGDRQ